MYVIIKDEEGIPEAIRITGLGNQLEFIIGRILILGVTALFAYFGSSSIQLKQFAVGVILLIASLYAFGRFLVFCY